MKPTVAGKSSVVLTAGEAGRSGKPLSCGQLNAVFVDTVKANYQRYLAKSLAFVKCINAAEDAVQEGVLAAHLKLGSLKQVSSMSAWLSRIIVHKSIDQLHKARKMPRFDEDTDELIRYTKYGLLDAPIWAEMSDPEEELLKSEGIGQLKRALESLDDRYRIPVLLKDIEGFSIREVAELLQLSESNTKVRIHRARVKLKSELNDYFFPEYMRGEK